jgi:uncharacterized short protein YbdD (DUF466 family)
MSDRANPAAAGDTRQPRAREPGLLARVGATVRRIIGAPDYAAYLEHQRTHHPGCEVLTEEEFVAERLTARYQQPGNRCC